MLSALVVFSQPLVDLMYSPEYRLAGWYCALASLACLVRVASDLGPLYLAYGDSWTHFKIMAVRTIALVLAMVAGYFIGQRWGQPGEGVLYGIIVAPLLAYPYQSLMYHRLNAWLPEIDMLAMIPAGLLLFGQALGAF